MAGVGAPDSEIKLEDDEGLDADGLPGTTDVGIMLAVELALPDAMGVPDMVGRGPVLRPDTGNSLEVELL